MWKTKSRRRPPSVYFRSCRPIFELFMKQRWIFLSIIIFLQCRTPKAEGLPTFFFVYSRSENSCELHPLANVLHLPLSTYCLIHSFPNASFFLCTDVLVMIDT